MYMSTMSRVSSGFHHFGGGFKKISGRVIAEAANTVGLIGVSGYSILASGVSGSVPQTNVSPLAYAGLGLGVLSFLDNAVQAQRDGDGSAKTVLGMMSGVAMIVSGLCMAGGARPGVSIGFSVIAAGIMAARGLAQLKKGDE